MFLAFVGFAFFMGSVVGGLVGGGLLLSVDRAKGVALWGAETPTSTPVFTPTPLPVITPTPTFTPFPTPTPAMEDVIAGIIPSVVTIINQQSYGLSFNPNEGRVVGSGVIVDERGYIATNNHVVENPGDLRVVLVDGRNLQAELVIADPTEDLAVVKISTDNLLPLKWGDSATVRPGQSVYAIGSPLGDFPSSVSFGIVSGLNRALEMNEHVIDGLIQTDAAINRGSSGGPLINTRGELIGINTFIIRESEDRGVAEGIAFALPAATAKSLLTPWIAAHSGETVPIPAAEEPGSN
jgi:2-alkenal reductase